MLTSTIATTASADQLSAATFGPVNPEPVPQRQARVVSEDTQSLTGFLGSQDKVSLSSEAQQKSQASQAASLSQQAPTAEANNNGDKSSEDPSNEFVQVSSSIGRAAQSGNLTRNEAMAIYQKIAALI